MTVINLRQNQKNENRICAQCAFRAGTQMWIKSNFCMYNQVLRMYSKLWTKFLFASIYSPSTKHTGHKSNQKTSFHNLHINFFPESMITNPAIWMVLCAVRIFISLPTGIVTLLWVTQNIPSFVFILDEYLLFSQLGSIFKQSIFKLVKPINSLFILYFLTLKLLWLPKTNCF